MTRNSFIRTLHQKCVVIWKLYARWLKYIFSWLVNDETESHYSNILNHINYLRNSLTHIMWFHLWHFTLNRIRLRLLIWCIIYSLNDCSIIYADIFSANLTFKSPLNGDVAYTIDYIAQLSFYIVFIFILIYFNSNRNEQCIWLLCVFYILLWNLQYQNWLWEIKYGVLHLRNQIYPIYLTNLIFQIWILKIHYSVNTYTWDSNFQNIMCNCCRKDDAGVRLLDSVASPLI